MGELDERNSSHRSVMERICRHCKAACTTLITRTAENDIALASLTKAMVLDALHFHVQARRRIFEERMDNADIVYVVTSCDVCGVELYVKVKLLSRGGAEKMLVISAHPPRRW